MSQSHYGNTSEAVWGQTKTLQGIFEATKGIVWHWNYIAIVHMQTDDFEVFEQEIGEAADGGVGDVQVLQDGVGGVWPDEGNLLQGIDKKTVRR